MYSLSLPLVEYQPFEKCKKKSTPGVNLEMYPIHASTVALVLSLSMVRVSPQSFVAFDTSFTTISGSDGNRVPTSYWHAMCVFMKGYKSAFVHYEQHDPSSIFISPSDQDFTTS